IAPHLNDTIDAFLTATADIPVVSKIVAEHRDLIKKLEITHFEGLLNGGLDNHYLELCRKTVQQKAAIGLDGRMRSTSGNFVLRAAMKALTRKHRFSTQRLAESTMVISQVIAFDISNALTLHRDATELATKARRAAIDESITDFSGAI